MMCEEGFFQKLMPEDASNVEYFKRIWSGLNLLLGTKESIEAWLKAPNPALDGETPMDWITAHRRPDLIADFVDDLVEGQPG